MGILKGTYAPHLNTPLGLTLVVLSHTSGQRDDICWTVFLSITHNLNLLNSCLLIWVIVFLVTILEINTKLIEIISLNPSLYSFYNFQREKYTSYFNI